MENQLDTNELIEMKCNEWENELKYSCPEKVLENVFRASNADFESVFIKINLLNSVYSTRILNDDMYKLAVFITGNHAKLDEKISNGDTNAVNMLVFESGTELRHFSFATKFCSFSNPSQYPIYDGIVDDMLWAYKKENPDKLNFKRNRIGADAEKERYKNFKDIVDGLIYELKIDEKHKYKNLDKFLWLTGKDKIKEAENNTKLNG